jgi:hypothetical protein
LVNKKFKVYLHAKDSFSFSLALPLAVYCLGGSVHQPGP